MSSRNGGSVRKLSSEYERVPLQAFSSSRANVGLYQDPIHTPPSRNSFVSISEFFDNLEPEPEPEPDINPDIQIPGKYASCNEPILPADESNIQMTNLICLGTMLVKLFTYFNISIKGRNEYDILFLILQIKLVVFATYFEIVSRRQSRYEKSYLHFMITFFISLAVFTLYITSVRVKGVITVFVN